MIRPPSSQIMATAQPLLPACTLRLATCCGARNSIIVTPKFVGFHKVPVADAQHVLRR